MRGERAWARSTAPQSHFPVEVFPDERHWGETRQRRTEKHLLNTRVRSLRHEGERLRACAALEHVNLTPAQVSSQLAGRAESGSEGPALKSVPAGPPKIRLSDSVVQSIATGRRLEWQACDKQEQPRSSCTRCLLDSLWEELLELAVLIGCDVSVLLLLIGWLSHVCFSGNWGPEETRAALDYAVCTSLQWNKLDIDRGHNKVTFDSE